MKPIVEIPETPEEDQRPTIKVLLNVISQLIESNRVLAKENQKLKDEINRLKGGNPRPKIKASTLENRNSYSVIQLLLDLFDYLIVFYLCPYGYYQYPLNNY